ncbi:MAG: NHL repeat-containing protein [Planctomycetota bacterium]|jgi:hypothetical protein
MMRLLIAAMALVGATGEAGANIYWIVENQTDKLFKVDVTTLQATEVGDLGFDFGFGGLGFAPDGTLYAWSTTDAGGQLYELNQTTGEGTLVGGSDLDGAQTFDISPQGDAIAWSLDGSLNNVNLNDGSTAFRVNTSPLSNGVASAFGTDAYYWADRDTDALYTVDIDNGDVTFVGDFSHNSLATNVGFNFADGMLYQTQNQFPLITMFQIDPSDGSSTMLGNVTGLPNQVNLEVTAGTFQIPAPGALALVGIGGLFAARRRRAGR